MTFDFDRIADDFDATRPFDPRLVDSIAKGIFDILGKGSELADIGSGTGRFLLPITNLGIKGYGIDISKNMLLKAKEKGLDNLILGNALQLPFPDDQFDASLITSVLHLVDDWKSVVKEACRISREAVISIDLGKSDDNPHNVLKSIMKDKGLNVPQKGPYETDLCESCVPENRIKLTEYVELRKREDMLAAYEKRTFTYQSELTEKENKECLMEMRKRYPEDTVSIDWDISLIIWNPERLSKDVSRTTFYYPH